MFDEVSSMDFSQLFSKTISFGIEPFAILTIKLADLLGLDCFFFFFVFSLLTFSALFFAALDINKEHAWLLFSACAIIVLPFSINIMRQGAAIAIIFLAIARTFSDNNRKYSLPLFILACTIHFSSILLLPVFFLKPSLERFGLKRVAIALSIMLILLLFVLPRLLPIIISSGLLPQKYLDAFGSFTSNLMNFDFLFFIALVFLLLITKNRNNSFSEKQNQLFILLVLAGVCYSGIGFFSAYLGRFSDFFWPFIVVSLWSIIDRFKDTRRFKQALLLGVMLAYFTTTTILMGNSELMPYGLSL
jgi:hypothetical protein